MKKRFALYTVLLGVLAALLYWSGPVREAVRAGLALCASTVIPSLFPFFVASSLLISLGFAEALGRPLERLMRPLFRLGGPASSALLLGFLGGYPVGARTAAELYRDGLCTRMEAERLLAFCNNCSPAFILGVLGGVFGSARTGLWLWLIHVASALGVGLLFRGWGHGQARTAECRPVSPIRAVPLTTAFVQAVQTGLQAMLGVCAFVVAFLVILLPLQGASGLPGTILTGAVELFNGAQRLTADRTGFILASGLLGWGGLSVHFQTLSVLGGSGLSTRGYWAGKTVQGLLSAGLAYGLTLLFQPF